MEYIDNYQDFEFDHIVDLEPFHMEAGLSHENIPKEDRLEPFIVASRMNYKEPTPRRCMTSLIYKWGREGGWYAYDFIPVTSACNVGFTKAFTLDGADVLAVLDRTSHPTERNGKINIFVWMHDSQGKKVLRESFVIGRVDVTSEYSEQFDVFKMDGKTFLGVAFYRHPRPCSSVKNRGDDCQYDYYTTIYELTPQGVLKDVAIFKNQTFGATKVKHLHDPITDENFLFIANSMDTTESRSTEGRVMVFKWSKESNEFVHVQDIPAEGVLELDTFMLQGQAHVIFSSFNKQRVIGQDLPVQYFLAAPIYRYNLMHQRFEEVQRIPTNSSTGAKFMTMCSRPLLALTSQATPDIDYPPNTSYLYSWKGVLGFQPELPISLKKVYDLEYMEIDGDYYLFTASKPSQTLKVVTS